MAVTSHHKELSAVRGASARLGQHLAETADQISSGALPTIDWLNDLTDYRQSLDLLKQNLDCDREALTDITLLELEQRLFAQQTLNASRDRLLQMSAAQSVDGREIPALEALRTRCFALSNRDASDEMWDEIVSVLDDRQPLGALWLFLSSQKDLADNVWQSLLEVMSTSLSRELVTCVTRGRIRLGVTHETDKTPLLPNFDHSLPASKTGDSDS